MKTGKKRERKVEVGALKWRTGKRGDGKEKQGIKFEPITVWVSLQ